jgi:hypothetical protein
MFSRLTTFTGLLALAGLGSLPGTVGAQPADVVSSLPAATTDSASALPSSNPGSVGGPACSDKIEGDEPLYPVPDENASALPLPKHPLLWKVLHPFRWIHGETPQKLARHRPDGETEEPALAMPRHPLLYRILHPFWRVHVEPTPGRLHFPVAYMIFHPFAFVRRGAPCCTVHHNDYCCATFQSEWFFAYGSCRDFFVDTCKKSVDNPNPYLRVRCAGCTEPKRPHPVPKSGDNPHFGAGTTMTGYVSPLAP